MLYLIGIGLNENQLTLEALAALKICKTVYLETYTSRYAGKDDPVPAIERIIGTRITLLPRGAVEEGAQTLVAQAKQHDIALLVYGNPLFATTHVQLLLDAKAARVQTRILQGISILNYLGQTGLDAYRFGRTITIVYPHANYAPVSFFDHLADNHARGLHTLCLLDIDTERQKFMSVTDALSILGKINAKRGTRILANATCIGLYGLGSPDERIEAGTAARLGQTKAQAFPQSLIVCGKLNEKEHEALDAFYPDESSAKKRKRGARSVLFDDEKIRSNQR
ncbi:MAG: diphthine synthase [Candidatus Diapherotrites archaeon]|nr:diphthine synthase [Candidatus Diapherotrites archaeon]